MRFAESLRTDVTPESVTLARLAVFRAVCHGSTIPVRFGRRRKTVADSK